MTVSGKRWAGLAEYLSPPARRFFCFCWSAIAPQRVGVYYDRPQGGRKTKDKKHFLSVFSDHWWSLRCFFLAFCFFFKSALLLHSFCDIIYHNYIAVLKLFLPLLWKGAHIMCKKVNFSISQDVDSFLNSMKETSGLSKSKILSMLVSGYGENLATDLQKYSKKGETVKQVSAFME